MARQIRLEVFDPATTPDTPEDGAQEQVRLAGYEAGYRAGWDDALATQAAEQARALAGIGRNLQALSFSYHDARTHVLRALEPLLTEIAARLLPGIAARTLPHLVAEQLLPLAETAANAPLVLHLHPASRAGAEHLIGPDPGLPLTIVEDPALGEGQVWLQAGDAGVRIDLDGALTAIRALLDDFYDLAAKEPDDG